MFLTPTQPAEILTPLLAGLVYVKI
jgi:hypothetical protein